MPLSVIRSYHVGKEHPPACRNGKEFAEIFESAKKAGVGLKNMLAGKPLLELGCGRENLCVSFRFAAEAGVSYYVGVDLDLPDGSVVGKIAMQTSDLKITLIEAEMLCFLKCVPEKSKANIMMNRVNGADMHLPGGFDGNMFAIEITEQMARIVEPGGIVFGMSLVPASFFSEDDWQIYRPAGKAYTFAVRK